MLASIFVFSCSLALFLLIRRSQLDDLMVVEADTKQAVMRPRRRAMWAMPITKAMPMLGDPVLCMWFGPRANDCHARENVQKLLTI